MKSRKEVACKHPQCEEIAEVDGFCSEHLTEFNQKRKNRDEVVQVLHSSVLKGKLFQKPELKEEFKKIQKWWHRACDSVNHRREDPILKDETQHALEWCIALALELVQEEKAFRDGDALNTASNFTRDWVWLRFKNIESGLMSNGVERSNKR